MEYLTKKQLQLIHSIVIDEIGGLHGVRDRQRLESIEAAPQQHVFGEELYPSLFLKTAVYAHDIIMFHPFSDGNKRTAMAAAGTFLELNGYQVIAEKGELEKLALKIAMKKIEKEEIAEWFKKNSEKI